MYDTPLTATELQILQEFLVLNDRPLNQSAIKLILRMLFTSSNRALRSTGLQRLRKINNAVNAVEVCRAWLATRDLQLAGLIKENRWIIYFEPRLRIFTALLNGQTYDIVEPTAGQVELIVEACTDKDPAIVEAANQAVLQLSSSTCQRVADLWVKNRLPVLLKLLVQHAYLPDSPIETRVMLALLLDTPEAIMSGTLSVVPTLAEACQDHDPIVVARACKLVAQTTRPDFQSALCDYVIRYDAPNLSAAILNGGYLPLEFAAKTLFLFLVEQWERYETLDFDRRILRAFYETGNPTLRGRIAAKIRKRGRLDYLPILATTSKLNKSDATLLVKILVHNEEWARLWTLVFDLALQLSVPIIRILTKQNWQPPNQYDQVVYHRLQELAYQEIALDEQALGLPPAIFQAKISAASYINDLAFSPTQPFLAIATSNRKLIVWNIQKGQIQEVYKDFAYSLGKVLYLADGTLVCAEQTNKDEGYKACGVYAFYEGRRFLITQHAGSVTALVDVGNGQILSAGQDKRLALWRVKPRSFIKESLPVYGFFDGQLCVSPNNRYVALLRKQALVLSLPELQPTGNTPATLLDTSCQAATFTLDNHSLLAGQTNGKINIYNLNNVGELSEPLADMQVACNLQTLAMLPNSGLLLAASWDGTIEFIDWSTRQHIDQLMTLGRQLTLLKLSPDGSFMAICDNDGSFSIWDLRILAARSLFSYPFAQAKPAHITTLAVVAQSHLKLPQALQNSLRYINTVLHYRFRHEIELEDDLTIRAGEFDIEIEG